MKNNTEKSEVESRKLSLKKETLQHLKVRTDLKGGLAHAALKLLLPRRIAAPVDPLL